MIKTLFTRKTLIAVALSCIWAILLAYVCVCIDGAHSVIPAKNTINKIAQGMHFESINGTMSGFICVMFTAVFEIIAVCAVCFEYRFAVFKNKNPRNVKNVLCYVGTAIAVLAVGVGFGMLFQSPLTADNVATTFKYLEQCVLLASLLFIAAFVGIGAILMLAINFIFVDKPFKFFSSKDEPAFEDENIDADFDVVGSFDGTLNQSATGTVADNAVVTGSAEGGVGGTGKAFVENDSLKNRSFVFPTLTAIDVEREGFDLERRESDKITLAKLCDDFRNYLAAEYGLYFDIDTIRFFVSGFGAGHFEILEGLSGTGKSSLPRYFAKFIGANALFMPVQATWRDKSNIFGYFNEFSGTYNETEFLASLYAANYDPDAINVYVLDEMNISRVEYYFADLLSVLEYPVEDWKVKIMNFPHDFVPPMKLDSGYIRIPENSWFIGTANRDDSTFTITDKVYDRAISIEFATRNEPFVPADKPATIKLTGTEFNKMLKDAANNQANRLTQKDIDNIDKIAEFVYDRFDVTVGNRILNQIENVVPVFVAAGGSKEDALDFMLCKKLLFKLEGRFEDYVKSALEELTELIGAVYGKGTLVRCERQLQKIMRTL